MIFGLFSSVESKTRKTAAQWLELADKIYKYRRDVMDAAARNSLLSTCEQLRSLLRERADASRLKLGIESLETVLRRTGSTHYPRSALVENIEFFLVAAIVILGVRAYIFQPFKIPTNSMWPTYNGMTGRVYQSPAEEPEKAEQAFNLVRNLARPRRIDAPASGEVLIPVGGTDGRGLASYRKVRGRNWGVIPADLREYQLVAGDRVATFTVPIDFDMDWVLRDAFFPDDPRPFRDIIIEKVEQGAYVDRSVRTADGSVRMRMIRTGRQVQAGGRLLSFDILTGDQLFVDRISYHFVTPSVGDGFVFRTGNIPQLSKSSGDQYYIKRLVGLPGDRLSIKGHTLYRNGKPIEGAPAFDLNARQDQGYVGYRSEGRMAEDAEMVVPPNHFLALGDNSANSLDGRFWGFVPAKDAVGRPLFIYYPFAQHWGLAR